MYRDLSGQILKCCFHLLLFAVKMLLLLNLTGWRAAEERRKCGREHRADEGQREKHCAVVASGPAIAHWWAL